MESQTEAGNTDAQKHFHNMEFWDRRAASFSRHSGKTRYPAEFIDLMVLTPDMTVLDMGCGAGTLAIPLASKVKQVIAVDFSKNMLAFLENGCRERGIANIRTIHGQWDDEWEVLGIGAVDIAIASRSLRADNAAHYLQKMMRAARRQIFVSAPVDSGPADARLLEYAGRKADTGSDYRRFITALLDMGIRANVAFIEESHEKQWDSPEDAFEDQRWMFYEMTRVEEEKIKTYLTNNLIVRNGRYCLPYKRKCHWAVMWWNLA